MSRAALALPVLFALALGACATTSPNPGATRARQAKRELQYQVREATLRNGAITVRLEIPPGAEGRKPAVLDKLHMRDTLFESGAIVVTYSINWLFLKGGDPLPKAESNPVGKWVLAAPTAQTLGQGYLRMILTTANEMIPEIVDYLVEQPEIDPSRIAITGASTEGFVALQAVSAEPRLAIAAVVATCGDYLRFLQFSDMGMQGKTLELDPAYEAEIRRNEPYRQPRKMLHAAVLMVNRTQDPLIPFACAESTARAMRSAYDKAGQADRFRFVSLDGEGHGINPEEASEVTTWLRTWLPRNGN